MGENNDQRRYFVEPTRVVPSAEEQSRDAERSASVNGPQAGPSEGCVPECRAGTASVSQGPQLDYPVAPIQTDGPASYTVPPSQTDVIQMAYLQARNEFVNRQVTAFKVWCFSNRKALMKLRSGANSAAVNAELCHEWSKLSEEEQRPFHQVAHGLNIQQKQTLPECEPENKRCRENLNSGCQAAQRASQAAGRQVAPAVGCPLSQAAPPSQSAPPAASQAVGRAAAGRAASRAPRRVSGQAAICPPSQPAGHQTLMAAGSAPSQAVGYAAAPPAGRTTAQATQPAASRAGKRAAERYQPSQPAGHQVSYSVRYQTLPAAGYQLPQVGADHQVHQSSFFSQVVPPVQYSLCYPGTYPVLATMPYSLDCCSCRPFYQYHPLDQHPWATPQYSRLFSRYPIASQAVQGVWGDRLVYLPSSSVAEAGGRSQQDVRSVATTSETNPLPGEETERSCKEELDVVGL